MSGLIQLTNTSKVYQMRGGDVHALKQVSLRIDNGEFVSVVGTSGSGKSTLLYVLGALIETTEGSYEFDGKSVTTMSDASRADLRGRAIGFVFQSFHLVPQLNIVRNVMLASRYCPYLNSKRELKTKAHDLIERVGLGHRKRHRPNELSNGEMQRVAIARALLTDPRVLLADEPTGNLDRKTRDEIFELMKSLNADGTTVVLVTHEPELAQRTPRQVHLADGEVTCEIA
ncbi:MAG: ABC transporter ATP-binding protein [Candidatus Poribacteria bacterium]